MKKEGAELGFVFLIFILLVSLFSGVIAQNEVSNQQTTFSETPIIPETSTEAETDTNTQTEEQPREIVEFNVDPGITPDNTIYFVKDTYQRIVVGNDPERALGYREQKIAEAKAMVEKGKPEEAKQVLDRALQYGDIVEREVSPDIKERVQESVKQVQYVLDDLKEKASDEGWTGVEEKSDENLEKEKRIGTASELVAKISELCEALAKLDSLQYADTCKSKDESPRWMREQDKELTEEQEEQVKIFVKKLSQCFENPEECDCKGTGVQKFEDFCLERSAVAVKCKEGDKNSCDSLESGGDPIELLPNYLIPAFKKVEGEYMSSKFNIYAPPECAEAKTPEECSEIMFQINAPQECVDAGLTGKSKGDEIKCKKIMFEKNPPKECLDAGIDSSDLDAPRKCAKVMFQLNAPQKCIDVGLNGESKEDERKCRELMINGEVGKSYAQTPKFNRDCNSIQDPAEKMKCFEEFYNNARVSFREDFAEREMNTREFAAEMGAKNPDRPCPDGFCDRFEQNNPDACPEDCGGQRIQSCQSQQQVENLKQDCKNRGQDAIVEDRGGCPWVICVGGNYRGDYGNFERREQIPEQVANGGMKCPDRICDSYERMNPLACPEDCGGARQVVQEPRQDYQEPMQPENRIDQPQEPYQEPEIQFSSQQPQIQQSEPAPEPAPESSPEPGVTGGVIGVSELTGASGNAFWDFWFSY